MEKVEIEIGKDFSPNLGGRWKTLGPNSGEEFYEKWLKEKFLYAYDKQLKLHIYMDGAKGYGSSFLDQSFGQLAREFKVDDVAETIVFHTKMFEWNVKYLKEKIWEIK